MIHTGPHDVKGFKKTPVSLVVKSAIACSLLGAVTGANAAIWELDNGLRIDLDTQVAYAAQWRMERQDSNLLGASNGLLSINADDGNLSFDKGDITQNRFSVSSDLDIAYQGDSFSGGVFVRARGFYDDAYSGTSANASSFCNQGLTDILGNINTGNCVDFDANKGIKDYHISRVEFLDAFVYSTFDIGEQSASLRVGDQVVSWGESLALYGGISSAQGPLDVSKANVPGVELKDIFMPVGQVYFETGLSDAFSFGAYYQYDWQRSRIDAPGSYMSAVDIIGEGVQSLIVPGVGVLPVIRNEPDAGQWGVTLRYLAEELNSTEFGFYYIRYNDTLPAFQLTGAPFLELEYFEDIELYGLSFGTVLGDTNVSGEISYRDGQPVQIALPGAFHFAPAQTIQAQVSVLHILASNSLADNMTFLGEIGFNRVMGIDATPFTALLPGGVNDVSAALDNDRTAAGYLAKLTADYYNIGPALDLTMSITFKHDFKGTSSVPFTFTKDKMDLALGADFTYLSAHRFGLKYVAFLTDTDRIVKDGDPLEFGHQLSDRDNVSVYYKYSF